MDDIMEMAQGKLGRVVALRLRPGTDVLLGLEEACKRAGINNGVILSAIGSLDGVQFCNPVELPEKKALVLERKAECRGILERSYR